MSQEQIALESGISQAAITSYELGRRRPGRDQLARLLQALNLDEQARNDVLLAAGYAPELLMSTRVRTRRQLSMAEAAAIVEARPWPALLLNERVEMLAANDAAMVIWGFDRSRLDHPIERNVLTMATDPSIVLRCLNRSEAMGGLIAMFKAHPHRAESLDEPSSYFNQVLARIYGGDPRLVREFIELWDNTPPYYRDKLSWTYRIEWQVPGALPMSFIATVHSASEIDSLDIDDWIPRDAETHRELERVLEERAP